MVVKIQLSVVSLTSDSRLLNVLYIISVSKLYVVDIGINCLCLNYIDVINGDVGHYIVAGFYTCEQTYLHIKSAYVAHIEVAAADRQILKFKYILINAEYVVEYYTCS